MRRLLPFLLDFGSGLLFLFLFLATGNIYLSTGFGIAAAIATLVWIWIRDRRIGAMQALGPTIVLVMGGATILFHDPRFVMLKPTLILGFIGAVMLRPGWMIPFLPPAALEAPRPLLVAIGYVYAATHFILAAANVVVANLVSLKTWAIYSATVPWPVFALLWLVSWWVVRGAVIAARRSSAQAANAQAA
jgi:intracellular septation protein A